MPRRKKPRGSKYLLNHNLGEVLAHSLLASERIEVGVLDLGLEVLSCVSCGFFGAAVGPG